MVSQKLSEQDVIQRAETLSFPSSVIEYFQGYLGQPPYGFLEPLRTKVLISKNLPKITGRPGASLESLDFIKLKQDLYDRYDKHSISDVDVLSAALYPKVFDEYRSFQAKYGDLSVLPTVYFLNPLKVGQEFSFELEKGKTLIITLLAIGPLNEATGKRDVYFNLNGEARVVSIEDEGPSSKDAKTTAKVSREKADSLNKSHVGAPMSGLVVDIRVKVGSPVKVGDPIAVMSAMSNFLHF